MAAKSPSSPLQSSGGRGLFSADSRQVAFLDKWTVTPFDPEVARTPPSSVISSLLLGFAEHPSAGDGVWQWICRPDGFNACPHCCFLVAILPRFDEEASL